MIYAGINHNHVIDDLDDESEDAAHHEDPEQIEEVELNVALAFEVAPEHALFGRFLICKVAQTALEHALFSKRRVDRDGECEQNEELDDARDEIGSNAGQHHVEEQLYEGGCKQQIRPAPGVTAAILEEGTAEHDEAHRVDNRDHDAQRDDDDGKRWVRAD